MSPVVHEWLNLIVRWAHVIAAIMWIGDSFLFMWLDSSLSKPTVAREGEVVGELWMAHSGGFYEVIKRKSLSALPPKLFWFKWESYTTWITGFLLLIIVYYMGGKAMLLDANSPLSQPQAVALSLGLIVLALGIYDVLCRTPLVKNNKAFGIVALTLLTTTAYILLNQHLLTARATFLQIGAMVGTVMTSNVFFRIIPSQKHMLAATAAGTPVDTSYGARAKQRSVHNHYATLPVLFTMLSNHFPGLYGHAMEDGHSDAWAILALLMVAGSGIKYTMNFRSLTPKWLMLGTLGCLGGVGALTMPPGDPPVLAELAKHAKVDVTSAKNIVQARCVTCHSAHPTHPAYQAPPAGVTLETVEQMQLFADRILFRAVVSKTMPLGNLTSITEEERLTLGAWIVQQHKD